MDLGGGKTLKPQAVRERIEIGLGGRTAFSTSCSFSSWSAHGDLSSLEPPVERSPADATDRAFMLIEPSEAAFKGKPYSLTSR